MPRGESDASLSEEALVREGAKSFCICSKIQREVKMNLRVQCDQGMFVL